MSISYSPHAILCSNINTNTTTTTINFTATIAAASTTTNNNNNSNEKKIYNKTKTSSMIDYSGYFSSYTFSEAHFIFSSVHSMQQYK